MKKIKTQLALTLVFVILGFLVAYQYKQLKDPVKQLTVQETEDLLQEIDILKAEKENLISQTSELQASLKSYEENAASTGSMNKTLKEQLDNTRLILGMVDVKGPGISMTLTPASTVLSPTGVEYLTDVELVYILNELNYAGAEAISINDIRVSIQTGIKSSSNNSYILINDEKISPREAITIRAIGDKEKLIGALSFNGAMDYNALVYYDIRFQPEDAVEISKYNKPFSTSFVKVEE